MNFLHSEVDAGPREVVRVTLDKQANVKMMDGNNFRRYRNGQRHDFYGGLAKASPLDLHPPHQGRWHGTWSWISAGTVAPWARPSLWSSKKPQRTPDRSCESLRTPASKVS